jgi:hypothetical protein
MTRLQTFDDFDNDTTGSAEYVPFQFREDKTKEGTLQWLNDNFDQTYMASRDRLMTYRRYCNRYKNAGLDQTGVVRELHRDFGPSNPTKPRVRTNFFYQYIDQKVSALARMKLSPKFIPHNDNEQDDLNDAEACNILVDFRARQLKLSMLMTKMDTMIFKYGTGVAKVSYDKAEGPLHPKYKDAVKKYGKIPEVGDDGKPTGKYLNPFDARIGDVCVDLITPDLIFPERYKNCMEDLNFMEELEFCDIEEVKADYPNKDVKKEDYTWLDIDQKGYNQDNKVMVHHFYHKPTRHLPYGIYIKYIESDILEMVDDEEELRKIMPDCELPFVVEHDIESEDEFWGRPFLINIEQLNNMHDLIQSGVARNIGVASHPKLVVPEGSVNLKQTNNEYGIMQYRGPQAPQWLQHQYVNRGEFEIQDRLEKKMDVLAKVYEISKGQVPAGITAASALRLLEDQEQIANYQVVERKKERVKMIYWKMMMSMDANYKEDDQRMVTILGQDNEYLIKSFKNKPKFEKLASVEMEYVSSLSDSRSGRVADIIDLNAANQKEPTFGRKEIIKLLDLGLEDAFKEETNYSAVTARTMLEKLKNGEKDIKPPEESDDLLEMYMIFSRFVESINFKMKLKKDRRANIIEYIKGLEYLMTEKAKKNMLFAAKVRGFDKFPMFYELGAEITMMPPQMPAPAPGQGQPQTENLDRQLEQEQQSMGGF